MVKRKNKKSSKTIKPLLYTGAALIALSPVAWVILPQSTLFKSIVCGSGCGYAGAGVGVYSLYATLTLFVLGLITLSIGLFQKYRH